MSDQGVLYIKTKLSTRRIHLGNLSDEGGHVTPQDPQLRLICNCIIRGVHDSVQTEFLGRTNTNRTEPNLTEVFRFGFRFENFHFSVSVRFVFGFGSVCVKPIFFKYSNIYKYITFYTLHKLYILLFIHYINYIYMYLYTL